ncbi:hypothetical protein BDZ94DRAFT_1238016 [Collybia nuda]|uniref:Uncharacterized protein n=1 Tax=Collybia nuda TaxID=64659 RepID=A0A9P6CCU2_9AGAR|nr:hypothetical protein BDZ94DRAFT_1238016 [Collybia nuda]
MGRGIKKFKARQGRNQTPIYQYLASLEATYLSSKGCGEARLGAAGRVAYVAWASDRTKDSLRQNTPDVKRLLWKVDTFQSETTISIYMIIAPALWTWWDLQGSKQGTSLYNVTCDPQRNTKFRTVFFGAPKYIFTNTLLLIVQISSGTFARLLERPDESEKHEKNVLVDRILEGRQ